VGLVAGAGGLLFGLEIVVFMVRVSFDGKPYRRAYMETFGAECIASPSDRTESGRAILAEHPDSTGSLGIAISEAVELAVQRDDTKYALGSVLNHVLLHQTVTGLESIEQMQMADDYPDMVIGCTGGGSNFAGLAFPFLHQKLRDGLNTEFIAVEPSACPTLTKGAFAYDFGDTAHLTPLVKMYTLGSGFVPPGFHAGGLRYHGMAPQISHLAKLGLIARAPTISSSASTPASGSPRPRASCRRRRPTTPCAPPSTRPRSAASPASPRPSCSTSAATATSTCRPTWTTRPAS
jgi:tryptophan synthase beta chain